MADEQAPGPLDSKSVDETHLQEIIDGLSPQECHRLYEMLEQKYNGPDMEKKYSLEDLKL